MRGKDRRELVACVIGLVAGLQAMADCILLKASSGTTVIIMVAVILLVYHYIRKALDEWAERTRPKQKHRKVKMYNLKEIETPDWPMIEI